MLKKGIIIIISVILIFTFCNTAFAAEGVFDSARFDVENPEIESTTTSFLANIIDVVQIVCVGIAIIVMIVLAIKYMGAAPEGKAEIKRNMVTYGIGAVIVFSAASLIDILLKFFAGNLQDNI